MKLRNKRTGEKAEELHDKYVLWQYAKETAEDDGDYNYPDFQEWLELKGVE